ncbi:MAG: formate--tetrahydrofolate ligase [Chrysiogenetes bacterium]|nr:formate--tetrahydrofolate ligase [Chrysiogenetes bacterium]
MATRKKAPKKAAKTASKKKSGRAKRVPSDLAIAQACKMRPVDEIAKKLGVPAKYLEHYGQYKAKVSLEGLSNGKTAGKLVLVSAMTPTKFGEGKTTTTVGLGQALAKLGKNVAIALREPSLGPCMGIKGGAAGGGYSQVVPMEDINLHFTGDLHAVSAAHNLLAACIDNAIFQNNNPLQIDPRRVLWPRVIDLNDRSLRQVVIGLGGTMQGVPRESGFDITAASEIMAILCLASSYTDLKKRISRIVVAFKYNGDPVTVQELGVAGALGALLKDALKPNLVQTLEGVPAFVHGGPFANIAQGTNTVLATKMAMAHADITVTEAGFGFDLGGEKFLHIKCRGAGLKPDAVVLVATCRALKLHGGLPPDGLKEPNLEALEGGLTNLEKHIHNVRKFGLPVVVAVNRFPGDTTEELHCVLNFCEKRGVPAAISDVHAGGGAGGMALGKLVAETLEAGTANFRPLYRLEEPVKAKIRTIAQEIYGAAEVVYEPAAEKDISEIERIGFGGLPICVAKTQNSLSDQAALLGAPRGFKLTVRRVHLSAGAGFLVPITGNILRMPGLPARPAALDVDINSRGEISGLF